MVRWPAQIPAGKVCAEVAGTIDVLPTILDLLESGDISAEEAAERLEKKYDTALATRDNGPLLTRVLYGFAIAFAGYHRLRSGSIEPEIIKARPRWPLAELG